MRSHNHRISANGLTHFVKDSGAETAPIVILLHGFPETHACWDKLTPMLVEAGYRVIAPDLRGFGETDMAPATSDYQIHIGPVPDILAICDSLNISRAHIVGHDFGAPVAWALAAQYPERFLSLTALSVGHVRAYLRAGAEQKRMGWYIVLHQMRGLCEAVYKFNNWAFVKWHWAERDTLDDVLAGIGRPGRLTAGLDWYRANASLGRMMRPPKMGAFGEEIVRIPTLGVWGSRERYLTEEQMTLSADYVEASWRYERLEGVSHWVPTEASEQLAPLLLEHWRKVE
ncbi:MAG: alpha/beta fold hydrolase [Pseudomonadota bacterium]